MPNIDNDPKYWRDRAAHLIAIADLIADENAKRVMLKIAESFGKLAERYERSTIADEAGASPHRDVQRRV